MKLRTFKMSAVALMLGLSASVATTTVHAQDSGAAPAAPSGPVFCPGYKKGKTTLVGQRAGKKVQEAFEAYNEDKVDEAIAILKDVDPSEDYDKAYVNQFIGNLLATKEGKGEEALKYLKSSVSPKILNDSDHARILKLIGDLNTQEQKYADAVSYYKQWMDFTCDEDEMVYLRIASAYNELKKYSEVIEPADNSIRVAEKPNKSPYLLKLNAYYESKKYPEAVKVAEALVNLFPEDPSNWVRLGSFYMAVERFDKAVETLDIAYMAGYLKKDVQIRQLASLYSNAGAPYKAAKLLEKFQNSGLLKKDADMYANIANSFHQAREYKDAANFYGKAAKIDSDPDYYRKQGDLLIVAEDYNGAVVALNNALERGVKDEGKVHFSLMQAHFYAGKYKQAYEQAQLAKKDKGTRRNASAWEPFIKEKAKNHGVKI